MNLMNKMASIGAVGATAASIACVEMMAHPPLTLAWSVAAGVAVAGIFALSGSLAAIALRAGLLGPTG